MNQELPPGQDADEIQGLTQVVAESLSNGEDPEKVAQQLIDSGWEADDANGFVASIQLHMLEAENAHANTGGDSEVQGWLLWAGGIIGINFLSWMFNWGFWIY